MSGPPPAPQPLTARGSLPEVNLAEATQQPPRSSLKEVSLAETTRGRTVTRVEERREWARAAVALVIVGALLLIVIGTFVLMFLGKPTSDLKDALQLLIAPVVGIVGAVTGFYFGSGGANSPRSPD